MAGKKLNYDLTCKILADPLFEVPQIFDWRSFENIQVSP
jgi:hypothetical protein